MKWIILCFLAVGSVAQADELSVRIVPAGLRDNGVRTLTFYSPDQSFYVVVTNVSKEPVRLWKEWCSWGYFTLSFEMTDDKGKVTPITKKVRGWDKNHPDWMLVGPGDSMVFAVNFDESLWTHSPLPAKG